MKIIPYGKQEITSSDIEAVVSVLQSDYLTQGPAIKEFEDAFANYIGVKYAVAVSNGTAALHLAAMTINIKPGDKVITTPITFAASANCVRYCGGEVVFADIDANTFLLDLNKVRALLEQHPKNTFKGIIPVDFAGYPVNMEAFRQLADEYNLWIIEDACHAPGAWFTDSKGNKQYSGNGVYTDLAIYSFHPVKHIAAGEGGMITTNKKELYEQLLLLRTHGITRKTDDFSNSVAIANGYPTNNESVFPGWYMEMQELGFNYRLTDFQAALGLSQLKRADMGLKRRLEIAKNYDNAFQHHPKVKSQGIQLTENNFENAYHLYVIEVNDRLGLYNYLRTKNIFAQVHYFPTHLMPYYRQFGWKPGDFPVAENYYSRCLSLPMYPSLSDEQQSYVINEINNYLATV
ncbi:UDP-4-amino-4,6-dideoxy-N-acetyl-beta-L-altrosamine transaminase [Chitinophaga sp. Ak27]|uniref:UDP-4-amino-4, 6-dideoxy-N-acetyl-beta-L-altrosamine transaminase n=1 Tax=Chitinophaga sp. Ak27 TaxID=2726116 RepID=UPI00145EC693|nr:UDP-4-amino-4,6-dideoxy-N-acetyl-beta-L-altrosamine transaminase [Chitinophaga sp. Ak27]NLU94407.1 UDP-4-amino-4,6-dideoxy-N-acetyl-beta-L-altrosamine transaminase [Chitinophaga sp. Ak27]